MEIFSRQISCGLIGPDGQDAIRRSRVAVVGAGGLGSWAAELLARCGVGYMRLVDNDVIEYSNLARQAMYTRRDAEEKTPKVTAAAKCLAGINPDCVVEPVMARLDTLNAQTLLAGFDAILDATDDWKTRFVINSWCVANDVPWVFGGAVATEGQVMPIIPHRTACLACVFDSPPDERDEIANKASTRGVIGPAVAAIASLQAAQILRIITASGEPPQFMRLDCWKFSVQTLNTKKPNPLCRVCGGPGDTK